MIDALARGSFRELEGRLRPFIARRVPSEADVDDVVQDVFLRMQRGLGALRDDERFGPWVYRVARSAIVDHHRRAAKHPVAGERALEEQVLETEEDDRAVERELSAYVASFVGMLASPYREALTLVELEGLTQKQAAEMLGISISGMKSRVQRGRLHLRKLLDECCHIAIDVRGRLVGCEPRPGGKRPPGGCECAVDGSEEVNSPSRARVHG